MRNGLFRKDEFRYHPDQDVYICPAGEALSPNHEGKLRDLKKIDYSNPAACPACPLRSRCTTNLRRVSRLENEAVLDRMAARLKARPEILDRRREHVEHPFGSIKQWMNQGAFLMEVLDNVRAEFSLSALVKSRPEVILADTRPGAPEIMFGIEHMGLPVGQSAESLGEVGKFALGYARAAPVGMLLAGLFDKALIP